MAWSADRMADTSRTRKGWATFPDCVATLQHLIISGRISTDRPCDSLTSFIADNVRFPGMDMVAAATVARGVGEHEGMAVEVVFPVPAETEKNAIVVLSDSGVRYLFVQESKVGMGFNPGMRIDGTAPTRIHVDSASTEKIIAEVLCSHVSGTDFLAVPAALGVARRYNVGFEVWQGFLEKTIMFRSSGETIEFLRVYEGFANIFLDGDDRVKAAAKAAEMRFVESMVS